MTANSFTEAVTLQTTIMLNIAKRLDERGYAVMVHGLNREGENERYLYNYISSAVPRFCAWLRRSVAVTVTPVGGWTRRTALAVLFRCCPPGPPPTKIETSHARRSASSSSASAADAS